MAAKDDSMRSMRVVFGREYGPVRCYSSIFVAFLCREWKLFQMSRCFTKMSRWFGLGILIEFCKWKGNHTCEDAQNLMGAPLITTTKHVLSYMVIWHFFLWWHISLSLGFDDSSPLIPSLKLAARASNRWWAPEGSRIVFQPSIFRANWLLVSGRVILPGTYLSSIFGLQPSKTRPFLVKTRVIWVLGMYIYYTLYVRWNYNQPL